MAKATCLTMLAVSCSVYDTSLLESGASPIGSGGAGATSGQSGSAGKASAGANNGGSAGTLSEDAGSSGMSEMAGEVESGGTAGMTGAAGGSGAAGTLGTSGASGSAGGGVAGSGGSGGAIGGGGGKGGSGGAGGATPVPATGCAKLSVPLDDANDRAHFVVTFPATVDMTVGSISMRVYVQAGVGGTIFNYVQDSAPNYHFFGVTTATRPGLPSLAGWTTITWDVGGQPDTATPVTNIVKTGIKRLGIEINAAPATVWSNPTIVYVDSITVSTPTVTQSFTFGSAATLTTTPTTSDPATPILWINSSSSDTKATGVALSWQATCP